MLGSETVNRQRRLFFINPEQLSGSPGLHDQKPLRGAWSDDDFPTAILCCRRICQASPTTDSPWGRPADFAKGTSALDCYLLQGYPYAVAAHSITDLGGTLLKSCDRPRRRGRQSGAFKSDGECRPRQRVHALPRFQRVGIAQTAGLCDALNRTNPTAMRSGHTSGGIDAFVNLTGRWLAFSPLPGS